MSTANPIPLESSRRLYQILLLPDFSSNEEVRSAYKKLALKYHPDKNLGDPGAAEKFREVRIAYEVLSHEDKKKKYDASLRVFLATVNGGGGAGGAGGGRSGRSAGGSARTFSPHGSTTNPYMAAYTSSPTGTGSTANFNANIYEELNRFRAARASRAATARTASAGNAQRSESSHYTKEQQELFRKRERERQGEIRRQREKEKTEQRERERDALRKEQEKQEELLRQRWQQQQRAFSLGQGPLRRRTAPVASGSPFEGGADPGAPSSSSPGTPNVSASGASGAAAVPELHIPASRSTPDRARKATPVGTPRSSSVRRGLTPRPVTPRTGSGMNSPLHAPAGSSPSSPPIGTAAAAAAAATRMGSPNVHSKPLHPRSPSGGGAASRPTAAAYSPMPSVRSNVGTPTGTTDTRASRTATNTSSISLNEEVNGDDAVEGDTAHPRRGVPLPTSSRTAASGASSRPKPVAPGVSSSASASDEDPEAGSATSPAPSSTSQPPAVQLFHQRVAAAHRSNLAAAYNMSSRPGTTATGAQPATADGVGSNVRANSRRRPSTPGNSTTTNNNNSSSSATVTPTANAGTTATPRATLRRMNTSNSAAASGGGSSSPRLSSTVNGNTASARPTTSAGATARQNFAATTSTGMLPNMAKSERDTLLASARRKASLPRGVGSAAGSANGSSNGEGGEKAGGGGTRRGVQGSARQRASSSSTSATATAALDRSRGGGSSSAVNNSSLQEDVPPLPLDQQLAYVAEDEGTERSQLIEREEGLAWQRVLRQAQREYGLLLYGKKLEATIAAEGAARRAIWSQMRQSYERLLCIARESQGRAAVELLERKGRLQLAGREAAEVYHTRRLVTRETELAEREAAARRRLLREYHSEFMYLLQVDERGTRIGLLGAERHVRQKCRRLFLDPTASSGASLNDSLPGAPIGVLETCDSMASTRNGLCSLLVSSPAGTTTSLPRDSVSGLAGGVSGGSSNAAVLTVCEEEVVARRVIEKNCELVVESVLRDRANATHALYLAQQETAVQHATQSLQSELNALREEVERLRRDRLSPSPTRSSPLPGPASSRHPTRTTSPPKLPITPPAVSSLHASASASSTQRQTSVEAEGNGGAASSSSSPSGGGAAQRTSAASATSTPSKKSGSANGVDRSLVQKYLRLKDPQSASPPSALSASTTTVTGVNNNTMNSSSGATTANGGGGGVDGPAESIYARPAQWKQTTGNEIHKRPTGASGSASASAKKENRGAPPSQPPPPQPSASLASSNGAGGGTAATTTPVKAADAAGVAPLSSMKSPPQSDSLQGSGKGVGSTSSPSTPRSGVRSALHGITRYFGGGGGGSALGGTDGSAGNAPSPSEKLGESGS